MVNLTLREIRGRLPGAPTQKTIARRARCSPSIVSRAEAGAPLGPETEAKLARAYGISLRRLRRARRPRKIA